LSWYWTMNEIQKPYLQQYNITLLNLFWRDSEVSLSALRIIQRYHGRGNGVALRNCSIGPDKRNMSWNRTGELGCIDVHFLLEPKPPHTSTLLQFNHLKTNQIRRHVSIDHVANTCAKPFGFFTVLYYFYY